MSGGLCKEMLTFEPMRMVNVKQLSEIRPTTLELSNLDQLYNYFNSVALFYDVNVGAAMHDQELDKDELQPAAADKDPANKLQSALEELLVHYPAAAGRSHFNETDGRYEVKYMPTSIMDNEDHLSYGVPFSVARANATLSGLGDVSDPHPSLDLLYPSIPKPNQNNHPPLPVVAIQVTTFTCGSFTLALTSNHMLTDAYAAAILLKNLCSIAKGEGIATPMDITNRREVVKPRVPPSPKERYSYICTHKRGEAHVKKELPYGVATRFSFSGASLETLRWRASNPHTKSCSRFQALLAFLWVTRAKCLAKSGSLPSLELPFRFPINIREKEFPTITQGYMGVAILLRVVSATLQDLCESPLPYVVQKIQSSMVQDIHKQECFQSIIDYIELQLQNGLFPYIDQATLSAPSLVNLPFYDTDCVWGCPIYCARPSRQLAQRIIILDDPRSKGWNVLVVLSSQEEYEIYQEEITKYMGTS